MAESVLPRFKPNAGFSLLELVIVMAIIALLAALVAPRLLGQYGQSQATATRAQLALLQRGLDAFRLDNGRYPNQTENLQALVEKPGAIPTWRGPYLDKRTLPKDAWGNDFIYVIPPRKGIDYDLYSMGQDGAPGGEGENADIGNW
ncbi:MAG: type II secretion system major pseudopilin GspG [Dongiaceae bacterium]